MYQIKPDDLNEQKSNTVENERACEVCIISSIAFEYYSQKQLDCLSLYKNGIVSLLDLHCGK